MRASTLTGSRWAMSASSGSASWRIRLRRNAGSAFVGSVADGQAERLAQRHRLVPAEGEQWLRRARRHGRETVEPRTAQEVEQHRLGLVVGGVAGEDAAGKGVVAGAAQAGLQVRSGRDLDAMQHEVDAEGGGCRPRDLGVGARVGANAVIDVVGADGATGRDGEHDQCRRVGTAGCRTRHWRAGRRERAAGEEFGRRVQRSGSLWRLLG